MRGTSYPAAIGKYLDVDSQSEHNGKLVQNMLDGDATTIWHSQWKDAQPEHPHYFIVDLGAERKISGFRLLNRQDGSANGFISEYALYAVSPDEELNAATDASLLAFGEPIIQGQLRPTIDEQRVGFQTMEARYVKFVSLSGAGETPFASIAEFNLECPE